ncbi:carboxypeptidase-like regulatory domain-containing protein [Emticicia sp.]|uniref:carboxypeptidase-like regulatory domain-containing protein n=1 Tax=Emticicia sp. TaxID=1930953 RepID=UPI00375307D6
MKRRIWFPFIFIIFLQILSNTNSFAQIIISGKVTDVAQNKALSNAIITLNKLNTEITLAYTLSKPSGQFELKTNASTDSLTLSIKMLGYATQRINISSRTQTINFALEETSIELKEVKVKPEPIKKYGDTLSYSVAAFKNKNDRVIADIIKKLPGIEVTPNGQILYQGEPINKYYIEGMDLLEGRYKLANDNLNVEAVTDVEIIENHQPIKMLNGVVYSEKAALNIKLKKNITTTGQISFGAGLSPLLWDVNFTPMIFTKKNQFLTTYQANNVGRNNASQLMRLTPGTFKSESGMESKQDWLGIQKLSNPSFKENRWLDNNSHIGSINVLKKLKNNLELRLIGDYSNDIQRQEGYTKTLFFSSKIDTISLLENKTNKLFFNNLKTDITLQKNDKGKYLKNSLKMKAYWDSQIGTIINLNGTLSQQLSNPFYIIANDYKDLFKVGKLLLTLNSSISLEKKPQQLVVSPGQFAGLLNGNKPFESIQQNVLQTSFFTDNSIQFMKIFKAISFDTQIGFMLEKQNLLSDISSQNATELNKIGKEFSNDLDWLNQKYYINLQSRYQRGKLNINLSTPINYYIYKIQDKAFNKAETVNRATFEPQLGLNYEVNNYWKITVSSSKNNSFGDISQMYYGYIMTSYRDIKRTNAPLFQAVNFSNSIGLSYRNPINATFANLFYSYSLRENNLLFVNKISQNGSLERNAIEQKNNNYAQSLNGSISKSFREIKTTINVATNVFEQKSQQIINNQTVEIIVRGIMPNLRISSSLSQWFGFEYFYKLSNLKNIVADVPKQSIIQQTHDLKLNFNPSQKWYLGINNEFYINNYNNTKNLFADLIFRKTIGTKKIDLEATWINIFNTKSLLSISNGAFNYVETSYNLRPSQFIIKTRFPL